MAKRITPRLIEAADDLGHIRAKISSLKEEQQSIEATLLASGFNEIDGELFRVTCVRASRKQVAWKKICETLGASRQIITANTKTIKVDSVRCVARKTS